MRSKLSLPVHVFLVAQLLNRVSIYSPLFKFFFCVLVVHFIMISAQMLISMSLFAPFDNREYTRVHAPYLDVKHFP